MSVEIVGIGALNVDELLHLPRMPGEDDSVPVERRERRGGGSAANTICWLAHLGHRTGFVGKVGTDELADLALKELERYGVDTSRIVRDEGRTGVAYCLIAGNDRRILVDPGVNDELRPEDVDLDYILEAELLHAGSFIGLRTETSLKTLKTVMRRASRELTVTFTPATMVLRGYSYLEPYLRAADVVFLNETEAKQLTGSVRDTLNRLSRLTDTVVVTRGPNPTLVRYGTETLEVPPERVPEEEITDPTGAGDAFAAGFIDGLLRGDPPDRCCKRGHEVARECLKVIGCRPRPRERDDARRPGQGE